MRMFLTLAVGAVTLALTALAGAGQAQAQNAGITIIQVAARHVQRPSEETGPIACTKLGCHHIPAGCHPEMTYDWLGNPTGYETAVCPDGRH